MPYSLLGRALRTASLALVLFPRIASADAEENKTLVRSAVLEMFQARNAKLAERFIDENYIEHNPRLKGGRAGVVAYLERMRLAFPNDYHAEIEDLVAEGDRVAVRIHWHGIQGGPFLGVAPSGQAISFTTADVWRIANGKLAEHWDVVDRMDRDLTLGLVARVNN